MLIKLFLLLKMRLCLYKIAAKYLLSPHFSMLFIHSYEKDFFYLHYNYELAESTIESKLTSLLNELKVLKFVRTLVIKFKKQLTKMKQCTVPLIQTQRQKQLFTTMCLD